MRHKVLVIVLVLLEVCDPEKRELVPRTAAGCKARGGVACLVLGCALCARLS